jgi:quinolinate synthase
MIKDIRKKILLLKKQRQAMILAHNYQRPEVQDIADFVGDSLELSQQAVKTKAKMIVFCGVNFMAETAKLLNPEKTVVMPDKTAICPMAGMINREKLIALKKAHPKAKVVCYINTTAETKAESDICCTSANAQKVIDSLSCQEVIFVPDQHLGQWIAKKSKKKFIFFRGFCPTHLRIHPSLILELKKAHPKALVLCHPECTEEVKNISDYVLGTGSMLKFTQKSPDKEFIIATENGMTYRLQKQSPDKKFYQASSLAICPNMKKTELPKILSALENPKDYEIFVDEKVAKKARKAIEKMLNIS